MGYLPWQRPGFDLGLKLGEMARKHPHLVGVVLGAHGLFTWGRTAKESYQTTLRIINKAVVWLEEHRALQKPVAVASGELHQYFRRPARVHVR